MQVHDVWVDAEEVVLLRRDVAWALRVCRIDTRAPSPLGELALAKLARMRAAELVLAGYRGATLMSGALVEVVLPAVHDAIDDTIADAAAALHDGCALDPRDYVDLDRRLVLARRLEAAVAGAPPPAA